MITPPSKQDLIQIILQWYPELEYLALKLIGLLNVSYSRIVCAPYSGHSAIYLYFLMLFAETFERVNELTNFQLGLMPSSISNGRFTLR